MYSDHRFTYKAFKLQSKMSPFHWVEYEIIINRTAIFLRLNREDSVLATDKMYHISVHECAHFFFEESVISDNLNLAYM